MSDQRVWRFYTEQEIVNDLLSYGLSKEEKNLIRSTDGDQLFSLDGSIGKWIRDYYRLLENDNPYVTVGAQQMSANIIATVWSILTGKDIPAPPVIEVKPEPKDWIYFYNTHGHD